MFIVFHSVLSSQPINGETFVLSLESIPHDLSHKLTLLALPSPSSVATPPAESQKCFNLYYYYNQ